MIKVHLTLDVAIHGGKTWMVVQPHVDESDLPRFIAGAPTDCLLLNPEACSAVKLAPVPLPKSTTGLTLVFQPGAVPLTRNPRKLRLDDPSAYRSTNFRDAVDPVVIPAAASFHELLYDQLNGAPNARDALRLAFWGGGRRTLADGMWAADDRAQVMVVSGVVTGQFETNLHSLLGLTFDISAAMGGAATHFELSLSTNDGVKPIDVRVDKASEFLAEARKLANAMAAGKGSIALTEGNVSTPLTQFEADAASQYEVAANEFPVLARPLWLDFQTYSSGQVPNLLRCHSAEENPIAGLYTMRALVDPADKAADDKAADDKAADDKAADDKAVKKIAVDVHPAFVFEAELRPYRDYGSRSDKIRVLKLVPRSAGPLITSFMEVFDSSPTKQAGQSAEVIWSGGDVRFRGDQVSVEVRCSKPVPGATLTLLGTFDLLWDRQEPAEPKSVLFFEEGGTDPDGSCEVFVLVKAASSLIADTVPVERTAKWSFNTLALAPRAEGKDPVIQVQRGNELKFELWKSISQCNAVVAAAHTIDSATFDPEKNCLKPTGNTPQQNRALVELNYNSLTKTWPAASRPKLLAAAAPAGVVIPFENAPITSGPNAIINHYYHLRLDGLGGEQDKALWDATARADGGRTWARALNELMERAVGQPVPTPLPGTLTPSFELEHTYGFRYSPAFDVPWELYLDFPLLLPGEVQRLPSGAPAVKRSAVKPLDPLTAVHQKQIDALPLLYLAYEGGPPPVRERLTVRLREALFAVDERVAPTAWRSLIDWKLARTIKLTVQGFRFAWSNTQRDGTVGQALLAGEKKDDHRIEKDLKSWLISAFESLIANNPVEPLELPAPAVTLWSQCHAIDFSVEIQRTTALEVALSGKTTLAFIAAPSAEARRGFVLSKPTRLTPEKTKDALLAPLIKREGPMPVRLDSGSDQVRAMRLTEPPVRRKGAPYAPAKPRGTLVAPAGPAAPSPGSSAVTLFPFGLPVAAHPSLRSDTPACCRTLFNLAQVLIDGTALRPTSAVKATEHFKTLALTLVPILKDLTGRAKACIVSDAPPDEAPTERLRNWFERELTSRPALYSTTEALLATRLAETPDDLFAVQFKRTSKSNPIEVTRRTVLERSFEAPPKLLEFFEALPTSVYRGGFSFKRPASRPTDADELRLERVERFLEPEVDVYPTASWAPVAGVSVVGGSSQTDNAIVQVSLPSPRHLAEPKLVFVTELQALKSKSDALTAELRHDELKKQYLREVSRLVTKWAGPHSVSESQRLLNLTDPLAGDEFCLSVGVVVADESVDTLNGAFDDSRPAWLATRGDFGKGTNAEDGSSASAALAKLLGWAQKGAGSSTAFAAGAIGSEALVAVLDGLDATKEIIEPPKPEKKNSELPRLCACALEPGQNTPSNPRFAVDRFPLTELESLFVVHCRCSCWVRPSLSLVQVRNAQTPTLQTQGRVVVTPPWLHRREHTRSIEFSMKAKPNDFPASLVTELRERGVVLPSGWEHARAVINASRRISTHYQEWNEGTKKWVPKPHLQSSVPVATWVREGSPANEPAKSFSTVDAGLRLTDTLAIDFRLQTIDGVEFLVVPNITVNVVA